MTLQNLYGDGVNVGPGYDSTTWTTNVYAHDNTIAHTGRNGFSVTAGNAIRLDNNTITQPGLWGVDIEPNGGSSGATNVQVTNSTFTPGGHTEPFVQAVGTSGGGVVSGITITGNTVRGGTLTTHSSLHQASVGATSRSPTTPATPPVTCSTTTPAAALWW
jgi:hypothetical protein